MALSRRARRARHLVAVSQFAGDAGAPQLAPGLHPRAGRNLDLQTSNGRVTRVAAGSSIRNSWFPAPLHYLALFLRPRFLAVLDIRDGLTLIEVWYSLVLALGVDPLREDQPLEDQWLSDLVEHWGPALRAFMIGLTRNGLSGTSRRDSVVGLHRLHALLHLAAPRHLGVLLSARRWRHSVDRSDRAAHSKNWADRSSWMRKVDRIERSNDQWIAHSPIGSFTARSIILATDAPNTRSILCASEATAPIANDLYFPRSMPTAILRFWYDTQPQSKSKRASSAAKSIVDNYFWLHRLQDQYVALEQSHGRQRHRGAHLRPAGTAGRTRRGAAGPRRQRCAERLSRTARPSDSSSHATQRATHTLFGLGRAEQHLSTVTPWPERLLLRRLGAAPVARLLSGTRLRDRHRSRECRVGITRSSTVAAARLSQAGSLRAAGSRS